MTKENTVIIGALAEVPYAEFMGDVNSKFCNGTAEWVEGCIYNSHCNEYQPEVQSDNLELTYDNFSKKVVNKV